ncbi:HNH endonuclease [Clostridium sp. ZBS13]|uniref:HNH endonuclease n=1 Tax=Clostridium sp. ZBS13 TaxID=2949971 RepID=UPI002079D472|nr:HNH endonuclease [Clostridium sp. ZBS13]
MIPIKVEDSKFENIKEEYLKKVNELFQDKRSSDINSKKEVIFKAINNELSRVNIKATIEDIFVADFNTLKNIKKSLDQLKLVYDGYEKRKSNNKGTYVKGSIYDVLYKKFNLLDKKWIINQLGITVCPYCNRDFINNRKTSMAAQLDHFYPRSKYPIFALSLYNLIPSCSACNSIKRQKDIDVSPYDTSFDFDSEIRFSYIPLSSEYLNDSTKLKIGIKYTNKFKKNIKNMQIDSAYEIHLDYVQELIKKAKIYNKMFREELLENYSGLISTEEELNRIVFGNYINKDDVKKRPLAKLTHDILEELGVIK